MKILVLQLARLGDIYQTWPVLRALKRQNPGTEVHLLTRTKFAPAAPPRPVVDRSWALDSREILAPMIDEKPDLTTSLAKLDGLCSALYSEGFAKIVNLSFSPLSSHLVEAIAGPDCDVVGYRRTRDGYLRIPDDASAYFYGQVGVGKSNRLHVIELFAHVAGVELVEDDWRAPEIDAVAAKSAVVSSVPEDAILLHVGASDPRKTFSWTKWSQVIKGLSATGRPLVLIGGAEDRTVSTRLTVAGGRGPLDLCGKTNLAELVEIVRRAKLLVGGDSGPMQIASLTGTSVFNVSFPIVNFWETGPRSPGSRIFVVDGEDAISSEVVVSEIVAQLDGRASHSPSVVAVGDRSTPYSGVSRATRGFEWELVRALYLGDAFPAPNSEVFLLGMNRLFEVNRLALEQFEALRRNPGNKTAASILDRADEIVDQILKMVPTAEPIVDWFRTERLRIGPMPTNELIQATEAIHLRLGDVLSLYVDQSGEMETIEGSAG